MTATARINANSHADDESEEETSEEEETSDEEEESPTVRKTDVPIRKKFDDEEDSDDVGAFSMAVKVVILTVSRLPTTGTKQKTRRRKGRRLLPPRPRPRQPQKRQPVIKSPKRNA